MAVETDVDRAAMLADFGVTATKGTDTFTVIFENAYADADGIAGRQPVALALDSDISTYSVAVGDTISIGGNNYTVRDPQPDGTGMTELYLEKQ